MTISQTESGASKDPKKRRNTIIIISIAAIAVLCLIAALVIGLILGKRNRNPEAVQSEEEIQSTEIDQSEEEACSFICDVNTENYSFGISCEDASHVTSEMLGQTTEYVYGPSGNRTGIKILINQEQTFHASGNVYLITGVIELDETNDSVAYNIQATGGVFGDTPQICSNADIAFEIPTETEAEGIEAEETEEPSDIIYAVPSTEYPTMADFRATINVNACDDAMARGEMMGGTYLCISSEDGAYIGEGNDILITRDEADITPVLQQVEMNSVVILIEGDQLWAVQFSAPDGMVLLPGIYEDAIQVSSAIGTSNNGLSIFGGGHSCEEITGRFEIMEIVWDTEGYLMSLAVNFEQHCDGESAGTYGYMRFNSETP